MMTGSSDIPLDQQGSMEIENSPLSDSAASWDLSHLDIILKAQYRHTHNSKCTNWVLNPASFTKEKETNFYYLYYITIYFLLVMHMYTTVQQMVLIVLHIVKFLKWINM